MITYNYNEALKLSGVIIGIYKITYLPTNKSYIGKSTDIFKRWKQHLYRDNKSNKDFHYLLWNEKEKFSFSIIEECKSDVLDEREKYWIQYYNSKNDGFNLTSGGECGTHYNYSDIAKIYQDNNCNATITAKQIGCDRETVIKATIAEKVKTNLKKEVYYIDNGIVHSFSSIAEASRSTGIDSSSISANCRGKRKSAGGFIWYYKEGGEE